MCIPSRNIGLLVVFLWILYHNVDSNTAHYITPSQTTKCPQGESGTCSTLTVLASNTSYFLNSNTEVRFLAGNHHLNGDLIISNISEFVIIFRNSSVTTSISCREGASLKFTNVSQLNISGLEFIRCRIIIKLVRQLTLEGTSFRDGIDGSALHLIQTNSSIFRSHFISNTVGMFWNNVGFTHTLSEERVRVGGAIAVTSSNLIINNSRFISNEAEIGGAIFSQMRSNVTITNCAFENNTVSGNKYRCFGGALYVGSGCSLTVQNTCFLNNTSGNTCSGGAIALLQSDFFDFHNFYSYVQAYWSGGSVPAWNIDSIWTNGNISKEDVFRRATKRAIANAGSMNIKNSLFFNNQAGQHGGAIYALFAFGITVNNSNFEQNEAIISGGVVYARNSILNMHNSFFDHNEAGTDGGTVFSYHSRIDVYNSSFHENRASDSGGVMKTNITKINVYNSSFHRNKANNDGGVFYASYSRVNFYNSSFLSNEAGKSGGVMYETKTDTSRLTKMSYMNKCTFLNNSAMEGGVLYVHGVLVTDFSCMYHRNWAKRNGGVFILNEGGIKISESSFASNSAGNSGGVLSILNYWFQSHIALERSNFTSNKAFVGGVIAMLANDDITVSDCEFTYNSAIKGGVVMYLLTGNNLTVNYSHFSHNSANGDGGVFYLGDQNKLTITHSAFYSNSAENSGGVVCSLIRTKLNITGDQNKFIRNQAKSGGVIYASESTVFLHSQSILMSNNEVVESGGALYLYKAKFSFISGNNTFIGNSATNGGSIYASRSNLSIEMYSQTTVDDNFATNKGGGLYLTMSQIKVRGYHIHIARNRAGKMGGGLHAEWSNIFIEGEAHFISNVAKHGGGVSLENNAFFHGISAKNHASTINFTLNRADSYGGGIYIEDDSYSDLCAADTETWASECFSNSVFLWFFNNSAGNSGFDLFGGFLDRCTVHNELPTKNEDSCNGSVERGITNLLRISNINLNTVSSHPVRLCFCTEGKPACGYQPGNVRINRGNSFTLEFIAYDQVYNTVNSSVLCSLNSSAGGLDVGQNVQKTDAGCTELNFTLFSPHSYEKLTLSVAGPCHVSGITERSVTIEITCSCPIGFEVYNVSGKSCDCVCDKVLQSYDKTHCDVKSQSIIRKDNFWINYVELSNMSGYIIYPNCPYDYCHAPEEDVAINLNIPYGYEAQCIKHRSGILCGSCQPGFSLSLGSTSCLHCPSYWPGLTVALILVVILSGVGLVVLVLVLNLTVAMGTLNAIIFYANIMAANKTALLSTSEVSFSSVVISWLNFEIGFYVCFFDGMDMYWKTWIKLAFPTYMILIVIVITVICNRSSFFSRLIGRRDPVATLATLILFSYTKFLQTIITAFSCAALAYPNGSRTFVWLPDASIDYLVDRRHIVLFIVAIAILLASLLYTVLLFTWQWILRCPTSRIKWIRNPKLSSFLETYHIPYEPKHRYWTGLLLLVRVVIYLVSAFNLNANPRFTLSTTAFTVSCVFLYMTVFGVKIYQNWLINAMETVTYLNVIGVSIYTWYTIDNSNRHQTTVTNISVGITFAQLLLVLCYHTLKCTILKRVQNHPFYSKSNNAMMRIIKGNYKAKPLLVDTDNDIHQFHKLLDEIDRPVNTDDYQVERKRVVPTKSVVVLPKSYKAPPLQTKVTKQKDNSPTKSEQQLLREEDSIMLLPHEENHDEEPMLTAENKQHTDNCSDVDTPECDRSTSSVEFPENDKKNSINYEFKEMKKLKSPPKHHVDTQDITVNSHWTRDETI